MPRLPDRFDLWVRRARECADPARQADYVLGALAGLKEWHFLNVGTRETPRAAEADLAGAACLLVFSDAGRVEELIAGDGGLSATGSLSLLTIPTAGAMAWCVERRTGLLVNPGEDAAMIPFEQVAAFHAEWSQRGGRQASGFWIPNMTTEEEDFWQEQGL